MSAVVPLDRKSTEAFSRAYIIVSWLYWVPNLLVAEWMVRRRRLRLQVA